MSKITIEELSESLKNKLKESGLQENEVKALINELAVHVTDFTGDEDIKIEGNGELGNLNELYTNYKDDIVGAINELFQNVDNGKQLIADAIDDPSITKDSTFEAMSEMIEYIKENFGGDPSAIKQIVCGYNMAFIVLNDGSLWACGDNTYGQLGFGDKTNRSSFSQVDVDNVKYIGCSDAQRNVFIVKNDGSLWACGLNTSGQLGLGDKTNKTTFTQVTTNINNDVKKIVGAQTHTIILKNDDTIWACGSGSSYQLGTGTTETYTTFVQVTNDVKDIVTNNNHTFIIKNDGSLWACGSNSYNQLGLDSGSTNKTFTQVTTNINNDVKQISTSLRHTFIVKNDGSLWACGTNSYGQLGLGDKTNKTTFTQVTTNINNDIKQVACGNNVTFIVKRDGSLLVCGINTNGQLGLGLTNSTDDKTTFTIVDSDVSSIYYGNNYSIIIKNDDIIWACGYNSSGQLGLGHTNDMNIFVQIPLVFNDDVGGSSNGGGGLDIISATELPATGKENQICVVTDNPVDNFIISSHDNDSTGKIILVPSNTVGDKLFTVENGNVTCSYYFDYVLNNNRRKSSYYWSNNSWNLLTRYNRVLFENGICIEPFNTGDYYKWTSGGPINITLNSSYLFESSFTNPIDFSKYNTIKVTAKTLKSSTALYMFLSPTLINNNRVSSSQVSSYPYVYTYIDTTEETYTLDISSWTGTGYLTFELPKNTSSATVNISYLDLT